MALVRKEIEGDMMWLDPKDGGISNTLVKKGRREDAFMWLLRKEASGIALECGANIGYCTISLAKLCDRVLAFEPDKRNLKLLRKNVEGLNNCKVFESALYDINGYISFGYAQRPNLSYITTKGEHEVPCVTIDSLNESVNFIKMDIEGGEVAAFKGAKETLENASNLKILLEVHPQNYNDQNNFEEILEWMVDIGYKFRFVISGKGKSHVVEEKYPVYKAFPKFDRKIYENIKPEDGIPWASRKKKNKKKVLRAIMLERK